MPAVMSPKEWRMSRAWNNAQQTLFGRGRARNVSGGSSPPFDKAQSRRFMMWVSLTLGLLVIIILMAISRNSDWGKGIAITGVILACALISVLGVIMWRGGFPRLKQKKE